MTANFFSNRGVGNNFCYGTVPRLRTTMPTSKSAESETYFKSAENMKRVFFCEFKSI